MAGKKLAEAVARSTAPGCTHPAEALELAQETNPTKFDATVEVAFRLGVDPRRADQMVRGTVSLPNGTGKTIRVAVFAEGDAARLAEEAGADVVGGEGPGRAGPGRLPRLRRRGRHARDDGPGRPPRPRPRPARPDAEPARPAPSPRTSAKAVSDIKGGKVEYRVDRHGNLHLILGKTSFAAEALIENYQVVLDEILRASRPRPRAATSRASPSPPRWAPASRSTRAPPAT